MDKRINQILHELASTAADAAAGARAVVMNAKETLGDTYDTVKLNLAWSRLDEEQEHLFSDIGRMLFLIHTGRIGDTVMSDEGEKSPQQVIGALLLNAEQIQQQLDALELKLGERAPCGPICTQCGKHCMAGDRFCHACGALLHTHTNQLP